MGNKKKMNIGVLALCLVPNLANADTLFKCMACTNKPANAHYTSSGTNTSNCSWSCDSGYKNINNKCMRDLSILKESDFEKLLSVDIDTCSNGVLGEGVYMVKLRGGKGGAGYGNTSIEQQYAVGSVFYISDSDEYNLCAAKDGVDSKNSTKKATGGTSSYFTLKSRLKYAETIGSDGSEAKKCSTGCLYYGKSCSPRPLSSSYRSCQNYTSADNICSVSLTGTPGVSNCKITNIEYAAGGGCAPNLFGGCSEKLLAPASDSVRQLFSDGGSSASRIKDTISVQNCSGSCAILYKLK